MSFFPGTALSERHLLGQQAGPGPPAGEDAAEFDRIEGYGLAPDTAREDAARRALQGEGERPAVAAGPLGDDVGNEAAVVAGGELEGVTG